MEFRNNQHLITGIVSDMFYDFSRKTIFDAITRLYQAGRHIDLILISHETRTEKSCLNEILESTKIYGSAFNLEEHIRILRELYQKRKLSDLSNRINVMNSGNEDPLQIISYTQETLSTILEVENNESDDSRVVASAISNESQNPEAFPPGSTPSCIPSLDKIIHCFSAGDLHIVAGRPGMGKTAFALSVADAMAVQGYLPYFVSLEMPKRQLTARLISFKSDIPVDKIIKNNLSDQERLRIKARWADVPHIEIDDSPRINEVLLRSKITNMKMRKGIKIAFIDYIQLMGSTLNTNNREQEISQISRSLKLLAKSLNIPIVALSQLSRQVEQRGGEKRPQLSDLRESGSLEQDADMVMFTYRPEYYKILEDGEGNDLRGIGKIIIAKNRNGPLDDVVLKWKAHKAQWVDMESSNPDFSDPQINFNNEDDKF